MRLTLTGMSGSGKSYWSQKLAEHGFTHICCDDLIAARLASRLTGEGDAIARLGRWMGFPFRPGYEERASRIPPPGKGDDGRIVAGTRGQTPLPPPNTW